MGSSTLSIPRRPQASPPMHGTSHLTQVNFPENVISQIFKKYFVFVYVIAHECSTHEGQKRASGSPELEFQVVWAADAGAGNQTLVVCKGS